MQREQDPKSSFVFTSERGSPFTTAGFARMVERAAVEAKLGFPAHPHMLRHACGFALANKGHDTRALQACLGHRNIQHTVRYTSCRRAGSRTSGDRTRGPATPPKHHQTFAALVEKERRLISQRTRDALAAKKAQGKQLCNPKLVRPILQKLAGQSLHAIAAELDRRGIKSWSGKPWNAVSVRNAGASYDASPRRQGVVLASQRRTRAVSDVLFLAMPAIVWMPNSVWARAKERKSGGALAI